MECANARAENQIEGKITKGKNIQKCTKRRRIRHPCIMCACARFTFCHMKSHKIGDYLTLLMLVDSGSKRNSSQKHIMKCTRQKKSLPQKLLHQHHKGQKPFLFCRPIQPFAHEENLQQQNKLNAERERESKRKNRLQKFQYEKFHSNLF